MTVEQHGGVSATASAGTRWSSATDGSIVDPEQPGCQGAGGPWSVRSAAGRRRRDRSARVGFTSVHRHLPDAFDGHGGRCSRSGCRRRRPPRRLRGRAGSRAPGCSWRSATSCAPRRARRTSGRGRGAPVATRFSSSVWSSTPPEMPAEQPASASPHAERRLVDGVRAAGSSSEHDASWRRAERLPRAVRRRRRGATSGDVIAVSHAERKQPMKRDRDGLALRPSAPQSGGTRRTASSSASTSELEDLLDRRPVEWSPVARPPATARRNRSSDPPPGGWAARSRGPASPSWSRPTPASAGRPVIDGGAKQHARTANTVQVGPESRATAASGSTSSGDREQSAPGAQALSRREAPDPGRTSRHDDLASR